MFPKLVVVPASLAVLAFCAAGASADTFLLGSSDSGISQGVNNSQTANQSSLGGIGGATIVNRSSYSPTVSQGATNANVNVAGSGPATSGDVFSVGNTKSGVTQGINNRQTAGQTNIGGGGGTTIINRSTYHPSISQGVTNANVNIGSSGSTGRGDLFLLGGNTSSLRQAINSSQSANQTGDSRPGGALIINRTGYTPSTSQGGLNANINGFIIGGGNGGGTLLGNEPSGMQIFVWD